MKKIPEIYVNKINKKIDNNKEVFYSYKDNDEIVEEVKLLDEYKLISKIFSIEDEYVYIRDKFGVPCKYYLKQYKK